MDLEYITLSKVVSKHSKTLLKSCVMYHAIEYYHFLTKELKMVRALACLGDKTSYGKLLLLLHPGMMVIELLPKPVTGQFVGNAMDIFQFSLLQWTGWKMVKHM